MISATLFQNLIDHLSEGDPLMFGEISSAVDAVPHSITAGDFFVSTSPQQVLWYEVLGLPERGSVMVRCYSRVVKRGDYDQVRVEALTARVSRELFERAQAHGFRTVRPSN